MAIKEVKYTVDIIESEEGWGSRFDETLEFDTEKDRDEFIKEYNKTLTSKKTPSWYMYARKGTDRIKDI